jgi:hypothetical protein
VLTNIEASKGAEIIKIFERREAKKEQTVYDDEVHHKQVR